MNLDSLLNASLELEKRIATDKPLRKYFSSLWKDRNHKPAALNRQQRGTAELTELRQVTLTFPPEMCELLELAANATGKAPSEILEESFVEYYGKKIAPPNGA